MNIYICQWPVRFPSSEYGGIVVVAAENSNQAEEMVLARVSHYDKLYNLDPINPVNIGIAHTTSPMIIDEFTT